MRRASYDRAARKRTVSLTINGDLLARARAMGINTSQVAEQALAQALREREAAALREDFAAELAACARYAREHGSFSELMDEYYEGED